MVTPVGHAGEFRVETHLPLLDHRTQLVSGEVHAVEVGEAVLSLNIFNNQFELSEGHFIVLEVSK